MCPRSLGRSYEYVPDCVDVPIVARSLASDLVERVSVADGGELVPSWLRAAAAHCSTPGAESGRINREYLKSAWTLCEPDLAGQERCTWSGHRGWCRCRYQPMRHQDVAASGQATCLRWDGDRLTLTCSTLRSVSDGVVSWRLPSAVHTVLASEEAVRSIPLAPRPSSMCCGPLMGSLHIATTLDLGIPLGLDLATIPKAESVRTADPGSSARTAA